MTDKKTGLFWFSNDLRLHDNPALMRTNSSVDELFCVYLSLNNLNLLSMPYSQTRSGEHQKQFLHQSLDNLDQSLSAMGQRLNHIVDSPRHGISELINELGVSDIFRSNNAGWYENQLWEALMEQYPDKRFHSVDTHTLYEIHDLPFSLADLPISFTQFKNALRDCPPIKPITKLTHLPPSPDRTTGVRLSPPIKESAFNGGEKSALAHLNTYFSTEKPAHYKEVRNAIDGWDNSCKLSPWLANGCLSVREVVAVLLDYEQDHVANDSTYWVYFELLWREYFQWYAHKHGRKLFAFQGIKSISPLNSYYPERFQKWVNGTTPYPIVNAGMNELRATGFLSNRGRQIVASCFVNELAMDWRYGAAYFESVLIDYDVASNWGNWQYLAGVGADPRDKRHFNLEKQTQQFDTDGRYIKLWAGDQPLQPLDSVDAADWPIV